MAQSKQLPLIPQLPRTEPDASNYDIALTRALHESLRIAAAKLAELEARIKTLEDAP